MEPVSLKTYPLSVVTNIGLRTTLVQSDSVFRGLADNILVVVSARQVGRTQSIHAPNELKLRYTDAQRINTPPHEGVCGQWRRNRGLRIDGSPVLRPVGLPGSSTLTIVPLRNLPGCHSIRSVAEAPTRAQAFLHPDP